MVVHSTFFGSIPFCSFTLKSLRSSLFRFVFSTLAPRVDGRLFCRRAFVLSSFASKFVSPLSYASRSSVQNTKSRRRGSILCLFPLILTKQVLTPKTTMLGIHTSKVEKLKLNALNLDKKTVPFGGGWISDRRSMHAKIKICANLQPKKNYVNLNL